MSRLKSRLGIHKPSPQLLARAEGALVAVILGSTLVFTKIAIASIGPLTIAALRYFLAFWLLFPFALRRRRLTDWSSQLWMRFFFIGLSFYLIGNGALFWGLRYIPATTGSLLLSLVPLLVLIASVLWLKEIPAPAQFVGISVGLVGFALFFSSGFQAGEAIGIGIVAIGLAGNAAFGVMGRNIAREQRVDTLSLTAVPLAFGAGMLLPLAFLVEGLPALSIKAYGIILLLAVMNTACVYLLYNHALRTLAAFEMSVLVNLTPFITAFWAWVFLGERLSTVQLIGMFVVISGTVLVQWRSKTDQDHLA